MNELIVDRMTVEACLPHADNALIDRLQTALQRWSDHSRLRAPDHLVARILPSLTLDLGRISEQHLQQELEPRLDRALADALARLVSQPEPVRHRLELARWLQHGTPLWTRPDLGHTALGALLYAEVRRADGVAWLLPLLARQSARARLLRLPGALVAALLDWLEEALPARQRHALPQASPALLPEHAAADTPPLEHDDGTQAGSAARVLASSAEHWPWTSTASSASNTRLSEDNIWYGAAAAATGQPPAAGSTNGQPADSLAANLVPSAQRDGQTQAGHAAEHATMPDGWPWTAAAATASTDRTSTAKPPATPPWMQHAADGHAPATRPPAPNHASTAAANLSASPGAAISTTPAGRLSRLLDAHDDSQPRSGRERAHWRQLLALIQQGLQQHDNSDDWLQRLASAIVHSGTPPGMWQPLLHSLQHSRLPLQPGSARVQAIIRQLRDANLQPGDQALLPRLQQALARLPGHSPLLHALQHASEQLDASALDHALQLWLADAMRQLQKPLQGWPQRSSEALYRLRLALRDHASPPPALLDALQQRLAAAARHDNDSRALCDLQRLPRLLASPLLPARLAEQIERFLADAAPSLAWRRKLMRQLRQWGEGRQPGGSLQAEADSHALLQDWHARLAILPPSAIRDGALRACQLPASAQRQQLAAALYALEKLLPTLASHHPSLPLSPHWAAQLRRRRLKLWQGSVASWQPLADTLAAQTAHPDGIAGLWPDVLHDSPAALDERISQQPDPTLKRLWHASRQASRPLRGEERRQWQQLASQLQQLISSQGIDSDSRFWCDDAGLVLLWPFLPELCRRCHWLDEAGHWRDEMSQRKAWRAISSLIGRDEDHEQGHSARVLLGLEIDEPLAEVPALDATEQQHLAAAVAAFEHSWASAMPAMPLRGGIEQLFLRRRGIWHLSQAGWQLNVETAAQDIMLARLPWSLGMILLPWREGLLTLNWQRPALPAVAQTEPDHDPQ